MLRKPLPLVVLGLLSLLLVASGPNGPYGFPLSNIVNPDVDEISPALTFNTGFMQTYAAVWQHNIGGPNNVIYARRTSADGQLIGSVIPVSPPTGQNADPDIVYNRDADQYLVVYSRDSAGIYGVILSNTLSTVGLGEFTIATGAGSYSTPAAAYSRTSHSYLVTWMVSGGGFQDIQARAITSAGTVGTNVLDVTGPLLNAPAFPDVAWSAPLNHFLVVWQMFAPTRMDQDVYGQVVGLTSLPPTPGPMAIGSNFAIFSAADTNTENDLYPAVASITKTGGTGQFLVATEAYHGGAAFIDGQLLTNTGSQDGPRLLISDGSGYQPAVAGSSAGRNYLVAWNDSAAAVSACKVYPDGSADPISTFTSVQGASDVAVAAGPANKFLLAADGWMNAGYPRDIFGYLWANWIYLPMILK